MSEDETNSEDGELPADPTADGGNPLADDASVDIFSEAPPVIPPSRAGGVADTGFDPDASFAAGAAAASTAMTIATRVESMDELFRLRCGRTACERNFSWPSTTRIQPT